MDPTATLILGVHLVGAALWVGGSVAIGVVATVLGRSERPEAVAELATVAQRLGWVMWPALLVTIATGAYNLTWAFPGGLAPGTTAGNALMVKFGLVALLLITAGAHAFVLGPRLRRARESGVDPERRLRLGRWNRYLGIVTVITSLLVVFAAAFVAGG